MVTAWKRSSLVTQATSCVAAEVKEPAERAHLQGLGKHARVRASALDPDERRAAALVRSGLICYIERRRFGARPRGPRSFAVVAELVDALP